MFGLEVIVRIAEEKLGGGDEFGIVVAQAENAAFVGGRGHGVNVVIVGEARVGVVVVDRDGVNFAEQALVDFGKIFGGIRSGLSGSEPSEAEDQEGSREQVKQTFHFGTSREPRPFSQHFLEQRWSLRGR
jgi:hypothetical protein